MDREALLQHINERESAAFRLIGRYSHGEAGAHARMDATGRRCVLKCHPNANRIGVVVIAIAATTTQFATTYGISSTFPVVCRPASASCAAPACSSGNSRPMRTDSSPAAIQVKRSRARHSSSSRVAM